MLRRGQDLTQSAMYKAKYQCASIPVVQLFLIKGEVEMAEYYTVSYITNCQAHGNTRCGDFLANRD